MRREGQEQKYSAYKSRGQGTLTPSTFGGGKSLSCPIPQDPWSIIIIMIKSYPVRRREDVEKYGTKYWTSSMAVKLWCLKTGTPLVHTYLKNSLVGPPPSSASSPAKDTLIGRVKLNALSRTAYMADLSSLLRLTIICARSPWTDCWRDEMTSWSVFCGLLEEILLSLYWQKYECSKYTRPARLPNGR